MQMLVMILDQISPLKFDLLLNDGSLDQEKIITPANSPAIRQGAPQAATIQVSVRHGRDKYR